MIIEVIGWYGASALLLAYAFVALQFFIPDDLFIILLNISGAIGIVIVSFWKKTYQPGILNVFWAIVGIISLLKIFI